MKQEQKSTFVKRIFIGIDLFVIASVMILIPKWFPLYFYLIYFRANLSVMMLGRERKTIFGALNIRKR